MNGAAGLGGGAGGDPRGGAGREREGGSAVFLRRGPCGFPISRIGPSVGVFRKSVGHRLEPG